MIVDVPVEVEGFLRDKRAVLPDQFTEHFAFIKNRFPDGHQVAPRIEQTREVIVRRIFQDFSLIAIQLGFYPVNCQKLSIDHSVDKQVKQKRWSRPNFLSLAFNQALHTLHKRSVIAVAVGDTDDEILPNCQVQLMRQHPIRRGFENIEDHERIIWKQVKLRQLFFVQAIFNAEGMDVEQADQGFQIIFCGVAIIEPEIPPVLGGFNRVRNGRNVRKLPNRVDEKEA